MLKALARAIRAYSTAGREANILAALRGRTLSGAQLYVETGLSLGTLYPALARMERDGKVRSWWTSGTPRRRLYAEND